MNLFKRTLLLISLCWGCNQLTLSLGGLVVESDSEMRVSKEVVAFNMYLAKLLVVISEKNTGLISTESIVVQKEERVLEIWSLEIEKNAAAILIEEESFKNVVR